MRQCPTTIQQAKGLARSRARAWAVPFGGTDVALAMSNGNVPVTARPASIPPT